MHHGKKWPQGITQAQVKALRRAHMAKKKGGSIHARNKLERLVCEAVAETLAQQELQAAGLLRDAGRGSDWVFGFAFLRRRCSRAGKAVT